MRKNKQNYWCNNGKCPCPVKDFVAQRLSYFSLEEAAEEVGESSRKVLNCLNNLKDWDLVCRVEKRNLWSPDQPL